MRRFAAYLLCLGALCLSACGKSTLDYVDPMIGTRGEGTQYGGMMPMAGVPFGSAHWVPMTRLTEVSVLSYNEADSLLLGFIGTRQPAIWMGDWGQVSFQPQIGDEPVTDYALRGQELASQAYTPYQGVVCAGGIETHYAALEHSAVFRFSKARHLVIDASRIATAGPSDPHPHPGHLTFSADGLSAAVVSKGKTLPLMRKNAYGEEYDFEYAFTGSAAGFSAPFSWNLTPVSVTKTSPRKFFPP